MKRYLLITIISLYSFELFAKFFIKGTVKEKKEHVEEVLPFATVSILVDGDLMGTTTDMDGKYQLEIPHPGSYEIKFNFMGLKEEIHQVNVSEKTTTEINALLLPDNEGVLLDEVVVSKVASKSGENRLLLERKNAIVSSEAIGAQQMSLQGISDAASGVNKVAGISLQQGSQTINVRGLGDRYNTSTLNGLPLPSNHAEFKNINLELFSSDVIEYIGVEKIFTANLFADVAGANIDIISKKHSGEDYFKVGLGAGYNSNLSKTDQFYLQDGPNWLGFNTTPHPTGAYAPTNYTVFENSWNPQTKNTLPNLDLNLSTGQEFNLGEKGKLNMFATLGFNNEWEYAEKTERTVNGSNDVRKDLSGEVFSYNTQSTGMINLNYEQKNMQLFYNGLILNSTEQNLNQLQGYIIDVVAYQNSESAYVRRAEFIKNLVTVNQLLGIHKIDKKNSINWSLGHNYVNNTIPDRRDNTMVGKKNTEIYYPSTNDASNNNRFWSDLKESEMALNLSFNHTFGASVDENTPYKGKWIVGYSGRLKQRDFDAVQYNHHITQNTASLDPIDIWNVDAYFNNDRLQKDLFELRTFYGDLNIPNIYSGKQQIHGGFSSLEYHLSNRLLILAGLRAEYINQSIHYETTISTGNNEFNEFNLFPSVSMKYETGSKSNARFSASKSYTLPQFKETAPFQFEGITVSTVGNPYLYPSIDYNADLKWEIFPSLGELFSVGAFGKYIQNPINQFVMSSASNDFTYANTGDWAYVVGVEMDVRKNIWKKTTSSESQTLTVAGNVSLMHSQQELDNEKVEQESEGKYISSFNTDREALQGAAPLLANASLSYHSQWKDGKRGFTSSLVYGYTSDRLYLLGYAGSIGNQVDKAYSDLDWVLQTTINRFNVSFTAKNLLNQTRQRVQENNPGDEVVLSFKQGINFKLGISFKF